MHENCRGGRRQGDIVACNTGWSGLESGSGASGGVMLCQIRGRGPNTYPHRRRIKFRPELSRHFSGLSFAQFGKNVNSCIPARCGWVGSGSGLEGRLRPAIWSSTTLMLLRSSVRFLFLRRIPKELCCQTGADPGFWSGGQRSFDLGDLEPKICSK